MGTESSSWGDGGATDNGPVATYRPWRVWNYGPASFDQTQMLVINYVWDLPKLSKHANNVVVENCEVNASGQLWGIRQVEGGSGLKVKNCKVYGIPQKTNRDASHVLTAISAAAEVSYCDISGVENAMDGGSVS